MSIGARFWKSLEIELLTEDIDVLRGKKGSSLVRREAVSAKVACTRRCETGLQFGFGHGKASSYDVRFVRVQS
jgi:hypothetical protein